MSYGWCCNVCLSWVQSLLEQVHLQITTVFSQTSFKCVFCCLPLFYLQFSHLHTCRRLRLVTRGIQSPPIRKMYCLYQVEWVSKKNNIVDPIIMSGTFIYISWIVIGLYASSVGHFPLNQIHHLTYTCSPFRKKEM